MKLSDLKPGFEFRDPTAPAAVGPDAKLFRHYREMIEAEQRTCQLDEELVSLRRAGDSALPAVAKRLAQLAAAMRKSQRASTAAGDRLSNTPALTIEGVLLKIAFGLSGEDVGEDGTVSHGAELIYSAACDLHRMAGADLGGGQLQVRQRGRTKAELRAAA